jgi:hypothetical protein
LFFDAEVNPEVRQRFQRSPAAGSVDGFSAKRKKEGPRGACRRPFPSLSGAEPLEFLPSVCPKTGGCSERQTD